MNPSAKDQKIYQCNHFMVALLRTTCLYLSDPLAVAAGPVDHACPAHWSCDPKVAQALLRLVLASLTISNKSIEIATVGSIVKTSNMEARRTYIEEDKSSHTILACLCLSYPALTRN